MAGTCCAFDDGEQALSCIAYFSRKLLLCPMFLSPLQQQLGLTGGRVLAICCQLHALPLTLAAHLE